MNRIALALLASAAFAQNWPQFRGPNASGVADGKPLPVTFDTAKGSNIRWKTPIPALRYQARSSGATRSS